MFVVFKQKTAYDMRISDWSSDVCSSDLTSVVVIAVPAILRRAGRVVGARASGDAAVIDEFRHRQGGRAGAVEHLHEAAGAEDSRCAVRCKIGSAACRERVCQEV